MIRSRRTAPQPLRRTLALPCVLALASFLGLALGLTGDGWRDALSAMLLFLPLAILFRHWLRRG